MNLEDLINLAKAEKTIDQDPRLNNYLDFVVDMPMVSTQPDGKWVEAQTIYWVYLKWCKTHKKNHLGRGEFFKRIQLDHKRWYSRNGVMYRVTSEPFVISREEWFLMRKHFKASHWRRKPSRKKHGKKTTL